MKFKRELSPNVRNVAEKPDQIRIILPTERKFWDADSILSCDSYRVCKIRQTN